MIKSVFLHGLDSSGSGTKGRFFSTRYPDMMRPDFNGTLQERMTHLRKLLGDGGQFIIFGSSFGGLMGACLAMDQPEDASPAVRRLLTDVVFKRPDR